uniref:PsbP C-terminal domain-containing protein n=1 Tax=Trieres chinensis TaxID=1514140 RepID=A0A7S2A319_TRICV|eukprot:CAMPEP_0183292434 /NCGR_PEP_ID=MMETSP0160_2-20130417/1487_1 /TAXON_ID=2839 ORGANISM="Odontella Sinensis, Strain Grunow 1884" /NCGR_SAMPLE_ID=MMETSP0160_2 /ASSEMBLY_ACC=CAM_ASM_000250 /LENGTH=223 /DNA_ID=CAMNT_0025453381 /DNA_START=42 /DNA_END=713 /DNA_ORIENTATION=+
MARLSVTALLLAAAATGASGFAGLNGASDAPTTSRRESFGVIGGAVAAGIAAGAPLPAIAAVTEETPRITTRMGGLLEPYQDSTRGWRTLVPSGWNKFDGEVGAYDTKWQDLVDNTENIKLSSTPVKSTTTSISAIGEDVQEVGEKLASKRSAKLISASERQTDGILFYKFDFALDDGTHQLLQLCVNKGRIWSLDANAKEKRWSKREEMYNNVMGSFMPKLS